MKAEICYSLSVVLNQMTCLFKGTNFQWEAHITVSRDLHVLSHVLSVTLSMGYGVSLIFLF